MITLIYTPHPLKYFEYLSSGMSIIAVDFPSHRTLPINEKLVFLNDCLKIQLGKNLNFYPKTENTKELSEEEIFNLSNLIEELTQQIFDLSKVKGLNEQVGMNYFLSKVHSIYN